MLQQTIQNALAVLAISCLANVDNWLPGRIGYSEVNAKVCFKSVRVRQGWYVESCRPPIQFANGT